MHRRNLRSAAPALIAAAAAMIAAGPLVAQSSAQSAAQWPTKRVQVVVPFTGTVAGVQLTLVPVDLMVAVTGVVPLLTA